jgi:predicted ATPase
MSRIGGAMSPSARMRVARSEISVLVEMLARAQDTGGLVLIRGDAGIGKSAPVNAISREEGNRRPNRGRTTRASFSPGEESARDIAESLYLRTAAQ